MMVQRQCVGPHLQMPKAPLGGGLVVLITVAIARGAQVKSAQAKSQELLGAQERRQVRR
jgi:hypothetical protein